jgi:hypothetical protein
MGIFFNLVALLCVWLPSAAKTRQQMRLGPVLGVEPGESLVWLLLAVQLCGHHLHCFAACMICQGRPGALTYQCADAALRLTPMQEYRFPFACWGAFCMERRTLSVESWCCRCKACMHLLAVVGPTEWPTIVYVQQQVCGAGSMLMTSSQRLLVETRVCVCVCVLLFPAAMRASSALQTCPALLQ